MGADMKAHVHISACKAKSGLAPNRKKMNQQGSCSSTPATYAQRGNQMKWRVFRWRVLGRIPNGAG